MICRMSSKRYLILQILSLLLIRFYLIMSSCFKIDLFKISKKIDELEGASYSVVMVTELELESVRGEVILIWDENLILESKMANNHHLKDEIALL